MLSARLFALALGLFVASGVPSGCSAGVVGGECRAGYSTCSGRCVDQLTDAEHCGSCTHACDDGTPCVSGICGGSDASTGGTGGNGGGRSGGSSGLANGGTAGVEGGTAGRGAASGRDGGTETDSSVGGDADVEGGTAGRGGTAGTGGRNSAGTAGVAGRGGTAGSVTDAQTCFPPFDTAEHCGDCNTRCVEPAHLCSLGNDGYFCTVRCTPPLSECGTQCVNFDTDENNCGQCGRRCASGICQGRQCVGVTAGHEILLCMDYSAAAPAGSAPAQLLENAVFLGPKSAVRVLAYSEYALPAVITTVRTTLDTAASNRGRTYTLANSTTSLDVANRLSVTSFEVLLVYDQPTAPAGRLLAAGTNIVDAVDSFVRAGGIVTVLAGASGRGEMPDFVTGAGLVTITGQEALTGELLYDRAPADAIGVNVLSPFRAPRESCRFLTAPPADPFTVFVVTDTPSSSGMLGAPAVIHRVVAP